MKKLTEKQTIIYNDFVDAFKNRLATGLKVSADSKGNLFFELETENGLTQIEGENIFKEFINKYPKCGVNWNMRAKLDVFTQELINKSETVFELSSGFKLERI